MAMLNTAGAARCVLLTSVISGISQKVTYDEDECFYRQRHLSSVQPFACQSTRIRMRSRLYSLVSPLETI